VFSHSILCHLSCSFVIASFLDSLSGILSRIVFSSVLLIVFGSVAQVSGIAFGSDCNSFALVPISVGVAHHKIGAEFMFVAPNGEEIPPTLAVGGVKVACGCCV